MPIERIPIVHKFGIISQSQRLELQERLLKQSSTVSESHNPPVASKYPLEVTDEFVQQFNAATTLQDLERLEVVAQKMLARAKRRVGLKENGKGFHVDLPYAWTELSQLAQCKGQIQEDCLDVLLASLDQSPMSRSHIPALFFLAETCLYWLRTDAINQPYLRTSELKILQMGDLVFARLFYHHMAGQLQRHDEFKNRLFTYLDGFAECQEAYNPYPNALLCIRYINEVGKMIVGLAAGRLDPGEMKEGDPVQTSEQYSQEETQEEADTYETRQSIKVEESVEELFREVSVRYEDESGGGGLSSSVHDLSPTLWHALDVWRCTHQLSGGLSDALHALACCGSGLAAETWVDGICALHILADAAKVNLSTLRVLQDLARGVPSPHSIDSAHRRKGGYAARRTPATTVGETNSSCVDDGPGLSDIYEKTEDGSTKPSRDQQRGEHADEDEEEEELKLPTSRGNKPPITGLHQEKTSSTFDPYSGVADSRNTTGWKAEVGSAAADRVSQASSVPTYTNEVDEHLAGLQGWHWEVAVTYTELLADIALHGSTSSIQKVALVGNGSGGGDSKPQCPMRSAGLVDLVDFNALQETLDGSHNDWSWRIRYTALRALVRVCQGTKGKTIAEGLQNAAYEALKQAQARERDNRVLEALKVGQVEESLSKLMNSQMADTFVSIGSRMASGLAKLYLPSLPPPVQSPPLKKYPLSTKSSPLKGKSRPEKPLRTTLKEEINLATALYEPPIPFKAKTNYDLKRIIEDQFRKELQQQLEEEEQGRQKELTDKQKEEEENERAAAEAQKNKMKGRHKKKGNPPKSPGKNSRSSLSPIQSRSAVNVS